MKYTPVGVDIAKQLEQKGIQLGEQRGMEKGEREATLKIARSLLKMGMSHESVLEATGLTEEDLLHITH